MKKDIKYLIYDARYHTDPDRAVVFEVCDSLEEANNSKDDYGTDCVVVKEEIEYE